MPGRVRSSKTTSNAALLDPPQPLAAVAHVHDLHAVRSEVRDEQRGEPLVVFNQQRTHAHVELESTLYCAASGLVAPPRGAGAFQGMSSHA